MTGLCDCENTNGNTGVANCELIMAAPYAVVFQRKTNNAGVSNGIDLSNPTTLGATLKAMTSATTPADERLYVLPVAENVTQEKTATAFDTPPSNRKYRVQDGVRTIMLELMGDNSSFRLLGNIESFECGEYAYFMIDVNGVFWGGSKVGTKLIGIPVASDSMDVNHVRATDTTVGRIQVQFDIEYGFDDSGIKGITPSVLGYRATELRGIISIYGETVGAPTATSVVVSLYQNTDNAVEYKKRFTGLLATDFVLKELSPTPSTITVATAVESYPGQYTLTYASQTASDILEVTATRGGFEVVPLRFTIP